MIKKTKSFEFNVLEIDDVEKIVSEKAGRKVSIGEISVEIQDALNLGAIERGKNKSFIICEVSVDGIDDDVFWNEDGSPLLNKYISDLAFLPVEYIFAFDVNKFKSFTRYIATDTY